MSSRLVGALAIWTVSFCVQLLSAEHAQPATARPNVVLIMTDDQGYGDFGFMGSTEVETPNLDRLAAESARFSRFYVSPVCSPTRACLMTGRYNYRTGVVDTWAGRSMMFTDETTLAECLQKAGYRTGIFGKWHLGDCYPLRPQDQGFQRSLVHRGGGIGQASDPLEGESRYTDPILMANGVEKRFQGYCTDVYYSAAGEFIDDAVSAGEPFFVYLPDNCPHGPFGDVPKKWLEHYREKLTSLQSPADPKLLERHQRIYAMISNVDEQIGRLLERLEKLGVADNTIVLFLTDNGPNTRRYLAGLRGMKTSVYEGGIRTPLLVRWPGHAKAKSVIESVHAHIDILPSLLDACQVSLPEGLDGRSFLPALSDPDHPFPNRTLLIQTHRGNTPQRYHHMAAIENRWKLVNHSGFGKDRPDGVPDWELFDLLADSGETQNRAAEHPEIVQRLKGEYEAWFDSVSQEREGEVRIPRIVVGPAAGDRVVLTRQDIRAPDPERPLSANAAWWLEFADTSRWDVELVFQEKAAEADGAGRFVLEWGVHEKLPDGRSLDDPPLVKLLRDDEGELTQVKVGDLPGSLGKGILRGYRETPNGERQLAYQVILTRTGDAGGADDE